MKFYSSLKKWGLIPLWIATIASGGSSPPSTQAPLPEGFVDLAAVAPSIQIEMRYSTEWNFMGRRVPGYDSNRCILTKPAALALARVQKSLLKKKLSLLMFDCYRPVRSVKAFVEWTQLSTDTQMKSIFYPDEPKATLIERGYIADRSGHSRGSTVDLTLIHLPVPSISSISSISFEGLRFREPGKDCRITAGIEKTGQLDMGTAYDCFSTLSNTEDGRISKPSMRNRKLLRSEMEAAGFENYPKEWWHYTLKNEPFPDRSFDF